ILAETSYEMDVLSAAIPIGIGALTANITRNDERTIELIKHLSKGNHILLYGFGISVILLGYTYLGDTYAAAFIPLISCSFFGYSVMEQTYGKNSVYKLHKSKLMSRLGRITYGLIVYQSIILVIGIIS